MGKRKPLRAGNVVEVRSREEIFATLDETGCLDGLPFMPEMLRHCGRTLRVGSIAHKTCDTISKTGGRRVHRAVHLEGIRCDGSAHGGCQALCLIFWKEDWLKARDEEPSPAHTGTFDENKLVAAAYKELGKDVKDIVYRCQATELLAATEPLSSWDYRQYIEDVRSGNETLWRMLSVLMFAAFHQLVKLGVGYRFLVGTYNRFQKWRGGCSYPFQMGKLPANQPTPLDSLGLRPGEAVRVKSHAEILETLNTHNKNRGLWFDAELVQFCGRDYRVLQRVNRLIDEATGKMREMKAPCIMLDGVVCKSRYTPDRYLCPRAIYPYWRESWLQRTSAADADPQAKSKV